MSEAERVAELRRAVTRLSEALLQGESNPLFVDAAIQRFEFCVELACKCLALRLSSEHGVELASPKPVLQQAYRLNLIGDEQVWLSMLRDRNLSVRTYREALAREICGRLPEYVLRLDALVTTL